MEGLVRRPTEEDKVEEVKKKLEKRGIPADDWQYYVNSLVEFSCFELSAALLTTTFQATNCDTPLNCLLL